MGTAGGSRWRSRRARARRGPRPAARPPTTTHTAACGRVAFHETSPRTRRTREERGAARGSVLARAATRSWWLGRGDASESGVPLVASGHCCLVFVVSSCRRRTGCRLRVLASSSPLAEARNSTCVGICKVFGRVFHMRQKSYSSDPNHSLEPRSISDSQTLTKSPATNECASSRHT